MADFDAYSPTREYVYKLTTRQESSAVCSFCGHVGAFYEDTDSGDILCRKCGKVQAERSLDPGAEWRNFSESNKDRSRAQQTDDYFDGLSTTIGRENYQGKPGEQLDKASIRMGIAQSRLALTQADRNMVSAFEKIAHYSELLRLNNDIRNKAKSIFKQFEDKRKASMRGAKSDAMVAAMLFMACKDEQVPRTFREIAKGTGLDEKEIKKFYKILIKTLPTPTIAAVAVVPADIVRRFCSALDLPNEVVTFAEEIARRATPLLEGKSPASIASAAILMASGKPDDKELEKGIAEAAGISRFTVRSIYREMLGKDIKLGTKALPGSGAATATPTSPVGLTENLAE